MIQAMRAFLRGFIMRRAVTRTQFIADRGKEIFFTAGFCHLVPCDIAIGILAFDHPICAILAGVFGIFIQHA